MNYQRVLKKVETLLLISLAAVTLTSCSSNPKSGAALNSSLTRDEKHRLYAAALAASDSPLDTQIFKEVCSAIGISDSAGNARDVLRLGRIVFGIHGGRRDARDRNVRAADRLDQRLEVGRAGDDRHALLLALELPPGVGDRPIGSVELRYKDRLLGRNVTREIPVRVRYGRSAPST